MEKKLFEVTDICTTTYTYLIYAESEENARNSIGYLSEEAHANYANIGESFVMAREISEYDTEEDFVWDFDEKRPCREILMPVSEAAKDING